MEGAETFEASPEAQGVTSDEQVVVLRNKLVYWEEKANELKEQVSQLRQDKMQLQGVQVPFPFSPPSPSTLTLVTKVRTF